MSHSPDKLRWAVVGVGRAGRARAQAIAADPRSELVAVWRGRFAAEAGAPVVDSFDAALAAADAVAIASPSEVHAEQVEAALARGRHVVVEYPLALDADTGAALFEQARAVGRVLHEEHIELLDAPATLLAALVRPSTIRAVEVAFEAPGDVVPGAELAWRNHARLHRALALGGPAASIDALSATPGQLTASLTLASGASLGLDLRVGPDLARRTRMTVTTVAGVWEQRGDQLYRDGTPVTLVGVGSLFGRDHKAAVARILDGAPPYVPEDRILHVLRLTDRLGAGRIGAIDPQ